MERQGSAALRSLSKREGGRRWPARHSPRQRFSSPLMNISSTTESTPSHPSPYLQPITSKGNRTGNTIPPPKIVTSEGEPRTKRVTRRHSDKASKRELAYLVVDLQGGEPPPDNSSLPVAAMNTSPAKGPAPKPQGRTAGSHYLRKGITKASSQPPPSPTQSPRSQVSSPPSTVNGTHSFSSSYTPPSSPRVPAHARSRSKSLKPPPPRPPPPSKQSLRNLKSMTIARTKTRSDSSVPQLKKTSPLTAEGGHDYEEFSPEDRPLGDYEDIDKDVDVGPAPTVVNSEPAPPLPPKPKTKGKFNRGVLSSPAAFSDTSPVVFSEPSEEAVFEDRPESIYEPVDVSMPVPPPRMKKMAKERLQSLRRSSFGTRKSGPGSSSSAAPQTDPITRRRTLNLSSEDISSPTLRTSTNDIAKRVLEEKEEEERKRRVGEEEGGRREGEEEEEGDVGGQGDYMEMKSQHDWEGPEVCPVLSEQDGPEESYVKMHPAPLSGSDDENESDYIMMDPSVFIEPSLCYMSTDLLAQRPHLTEKR